MAASGVDGGEDIDNVLVEWVRGLEIKYLPRFHASQIFCVLVSAWGPPVAKPIDPDHANRSISSTTCGTVRSLRPSPQKGVRIQRYEGCEPGFDDCNRQKCVAAGTDVQEKFGGGHEHRWFALKVSTALLTTA